jgi:hypothetical protein
MGACRNVVSEFVLREHVSVLLPSHQSTGHFSTMVRLTSASSLELQWCLTSVYGPVAMADKPDFLKELHLIRSFLDKDGYQDVVAVLMVRRSHHSLAPFYSTPTHIN